MNEFSLIETFFATEKSANNRDGISLGIGDDCCLLEIGNSMLAVSVDTLVDGVHFPKDADPELLGQRALRVCLSDLAAMGAAPRWFTLALTLPVANNTWLEGFSRGLFAAAKEFSCHLVGGDTTKGPLTISLQVMGELLANENNAAVNPPLKRSGAAVGDTVYVSGTLGDAAAALDCMTNNLSLESPVREYLEKRFYLPQPRFDVAKKIVGVASAAIDISDGLLADLGHICRLSGVGAELDLSQLPVSEALQTIEDVLLREKWMLQGGDDYELCFTVPPEKCVIVDEMTLSGTLNACAIGKITEGNELRCFRQDELIEIDKSGYQHFG